MSLRGERVVVAGLGLIGGSLARDLAALGLEVVGVDRPAVLRAARRQGVIASASVSFEEALGRATLLVLSGPPRLNRAWLARVARLGRRDLLVTDTGSVKGGIVADAHGLLLTRFVGGHPMAGSERSGFGASRAGLFAGRPWLLTPGPDVDPHALRRVRALVRAVGAKPMRLGAAEHDRALAFLSHLPQIVAWALRDTARGDAVARRCLTAAGPGFHDMTRLAQSPRGLWREILADNAPAVRRALLALSRELRAARP